MKITVLIEDDGNEDSGRATLQIVKKFNPPLTQVIIGLQDLVDDMNTVLMNDACALMVKDEVFTPTRIQSLEYSNKIRARAMQGYRKELTVTSVPGSPKGGGRR